MPLDVADFVIKDGIIWRRVGKALETANAGECAGYASLLWGALRASDERLESAGARVNIQMGCDTAEHMADEIERLRSDLALLGPVTTPTHGLLCASCIQDVSPTWTYCPYCGSQDRNSATGERLSRVVAK